MSNVKKPEPIGYFACNPETLKPEWDEGCVCQDNIYDPDDTGTVGRPFVFVDQAEAYANELATERVREALELAAQEADDWAMQYVEVDSAPSRVGDAIRALIPNQ